MAKLFLIATLVLLISTSICQAGKISDKNKIEVEEAITIGKAGLQKLLDESYHYRVEYDSLVVVPVHSRIIWKNDFYLIYFLKDGYFQAELEVDRATGKATILSIGKISQPYRPIGGGMFNLRYFMGDSVMIFAERRQSLKIDSTRMVYFGVAPKLGKRGVCWETFSGEGPRYISLTGAISTSEEMIREINFYQYANGNRFADSIKAVELLGELDRLEGMTDGERRQLKIHRQTHDSLINNCKTELEAIYGRFRQLRPKVESGGKK